MKNDVFKNYTDKKFYNYLKEHQILQEIQFDVLDLELKNGSDLIDDIILFRNFLTQSQIVHYKASMFQTTYVDVKKVSQLFEFKAEDIRWLKDNKIFPLCFSDGILRIAMDDPEDIKVLDYFKNLVKEYGITHFKNQIYYAPAYEILLKWTKIEKTVYSKLKDSIEILNCILERAIAFECSDIHFHPQKNYVEVSFRFSGILKGECVLSKEVWSLILNRLKVLSNLDVTESRKPQSGHHELFILEKRVDLRISTYPSVYGENLNIRLLQQYSELRSLNDLGFDEDILIELKKLILQPQGLFVITGPTGSGKTSTLYAVIQEIQKNNKSIMTLESPVECYLPGIKQTEIREDVLMNYAQGIRSVLRQDPDVIMIGEIRDEETAAMAVRAALTGHFVIATMHTTDTLGVPLRLKELSVSHQLMSETLVGVLSQRLIRVQCGVCLDKESSSLDCGNCYLGYTHREALGEILTLDSEWSDLFCNSSRKLLEEKRNEKKLISLKERIGSWIIKGKTTIEERQRIFGV